MTPDETRAAPPGGGSGRAKRAFRALLWLGLGAGLLPFAWAFGFCFPAGDDFDEATRAMFLFDIPGGLYEIGREWLSWSGRYTYHFLAVFLGKAAELREASGLACGAVLALHGVALYGLARVAGLARRDAAPLAALGLLALCAAYAHLWVFYLLTESLTSGLQSAAALLFFWSLCALWKAGAAHGAAPSDEDASLALRRARRAACGLGVLAVGVFEHSALAVLCAAALACALAWVHDRRDSPAEGGGRLPDFLRVGCWCLGALLFSFLAPGNFARRAARGVDAATVRRQLEAVPADWLQALLAFAHSLWPVAAVVLALHLFFLGRRGPRSLARADALLLAGLAPAAFCLFSLGLTLLHALSDVPLMSAAKLPASLGLYAACALGLAVYALLRALGRRPAWGRGAALLAGAGLLALCMAGDNFQRALRNAVNGDLALYARAMEARGDWLRHEGERHAGAGRFRLGLAGELLHPGSRRRSTPAGAPVTLVAQWPRRVFPVIGADGLSGRAARWPNPWAAWLYGVEAVATAAPKGAAAVAAVTRSLGAGGERETTREAPHPPALHPAHQDGPQAASHPDGPVALALPPEARRLGLTGAWRVNAQGGPNPTFDRTWLVVMAEKPLPKRVGLLVPSPLSRARLAPLWAQACLLRRLERQAAIVPGLPGRWAAPELSFTCAAYRVKAQAGYCYAFPLGPAAPLAAGGATPQPGQWPGGLFLRLGGAGFLRLGPGAPSLDSGPESG